MSDERRPQVVEKRRHLRVHTQPRGRHREDFWRRQFPVGQHTHKFAPRLRRVRDEVGQGADALARNQMERTPEGETNTPSLRSSLEVRA